MSLDHIRQLLAELGPWQPDDRPAVRCARSILLIARRNDGRLSGAQRMQLVAMGYLQTEGAE